MLLVTEQSAFNNWKGRITRKANLDGVIANRSLTFSTRLLFSKRRQSGGFYGSCT